MTVAVCSMVLSKVTEAVTMLVDSTVEYSISVLLKVSEVVFNADWHKIYTGSGTTVVISHGAQSIWAWLIFEGDLNAMIN